jgi:rubrerythrin
MRYLIYAEAARKEGFSNVARLFTAISDAERVHATNHFTALRSERGAFDVTSAAGFGLTTTAENLDIAIGGERFEIEHMYPAYLAEAERVGEADAQTSFRYALEAEKIHAAMYAKAKAAVTARRDLELGPVQICGVCGHTLEGKAPDFCPICGSPAKVFKAFP